MSVPKIIYTGVDAYIINMTRTIQAGFVDVDNHINQVYDLNKQTKNSLKLENYTLDEINSSINSYINAVNVDVYSRFAMLNGAFFTSNVNVANFINTSFINVSSNANIFSTLIVNNVQAYGRIVTANINVQNNANVFTNLYSNNVFAYGKIGVGTQTPSVRLVVSNNGAQGLECDYSSGLNAMYFETIDRSISSDVDLAFYHSQAFATRFYASGAEKVRVHTNGYLGVGTVTPASAVSINGGLHVGGDSDAGDNNLLVDGYSTLGSSAPKIKIAKFSGTNTASSQGASVTISHGLNGAKIISATVQVHFAADGAVPPEYTGVAGYQFSFFFDTNNITVLNSAANSGNILSKDIKALLIYEE